MEISKSVFQDKGKRVSGASGRNKQQEKTNMWINLNLHNITIKTIIIML